MPAKTGAGNPAGCPSLPSLPAVVHTLVPQIVVTPEPATADDGVVTIWVAVQLSVQGSSTAAIEQGLYDPASDRRSSQGAPRHGFFLYDVSLELLPLSESTVVEVLGDKACPT
ncbi:hypothetical protein MYCTH_2298951 [Thermothelomyces thermophilus ATCC 42464]|uniref:Uncharacterized protein n=1 Tax=Thermothelomyces thermophilus (strain ATCC 42464 / BCRC 31852 / DSM 1799) TaxID=573729 RepID=G2Q3X9_THET4|nr:uncharacterized protein MYCTH_2298951 [Thermothelomyces thermophilus ATCC 42464]AEO55282.1 hypothetical protein MYCTH_2298951 [Thermothelomyces thermophilus ATCC 42464]